MRHGITIPFDVFQDRKMLELVKRAEALGYADAWSSEASGSAAFSPVAAAAAVTEKMRFGTAIVPVFTRPPALIAMEAATVQNLSGGRFILGLGISTPTIVEQWMGVPYKKQVTRLRETVAAVRAILSGQKVTTAGKTVAINGFRLDAPPAAPVPIYIAAQGPQMLRIVGEIGDGVIVNWVTPEHVPAMLEHVKAGAREAGKDPDKVDVVCRILVGVDEDEAQIRSMMRRSLTAYVTVPQYNKFFREFGWEKEARAASEAWSAGDRKTAMMAIPDKMVESIFVLGNGEQCRKRLEAYGAAGITTTALLFVSLEPNVEERRKRIMRALEQVAPR